MKSTITNKTWALAFLLTLATLCYGVFEIWTSQRELSSQEQSDIAQTAVDEALQNFKEFENSFVSRSNHFSAEVKQQLAEDEPLQAIAEQATQNYDFWGTSLFKNQKALVWTGFSLSKIPEPAASNTKQESVTVEQTNNVTYLKYRTSIEVPKKDSSAVFQLVTKKRIKQNNVLSIGQNTELDPSTYLQPASEWTVHFSFFEEAPENPLHLAVISTQHIDSAGVIYSLQKDYATYRRAQQNQSFLIRAVFYVFIIILATLFLISISRELPKWRSLFLKLLAISLAWLFFSTLDYGTHWIELFHPVLKQNFADIKPLLVYSVHSFFTFLIAVSIFKPLFYNPLEPSNKASSLVGIILFIYGMLSAFLLHFFLFETYSLFIRTSIQALDLNIFPGVETLMFYMMGGVFVLSCIIIIISLGRFLLSSALYAPFLSILIAVGGLAVGLLVLSGFNFYSAWLFLTIVLFFAVNIAFIFLTHRNPSLFSNISRLRLLLLFSFVGVCVTYIAVYKGYSERLSNQMEQATRLFVDEDEARAETIAQVLLTGLEQSTSNLTAQDFKERPTFVENYFTQQTKQVISFEWDRFSISTQLIDNNGTIMGEYASDLDSPAWTRAFDMPSLIIPFESEQIRIDNLRPIIRNRPLHEASSNYSSFRRAWIPLHSADSRERIGWILCSVYRERPQYEKPLRAVIAAENNNKWNTSISITEYLGGITSRQNVVGTPIELPGYLRLPDDLTQRLQQDSTFYRTESLANQSIRELFIATNNNKVIRAATVHPGFDNHLFSIIRFFFCAVLTGILVFSVLFWKKNLNILGHNHRFRDRLIDRFIFASLICFIALIATTYYAIKGQNQKSVQDQLLSKLENLSESISLQEVQENSSSPISLNKLASTLDADASLYRNHSIDHSTTGQIYQQHLLPQQLPWGVYQSIYKRGNRQVTRKIYLGNQQLLIGYQPWLNSDQEIAGIVAIPTFLEAPKFNEQLLSTTSYLFGIYAIVFGVFILGAALISTQLTAPLEALHKGLKKISGGSLETTLPVKSKDEIGALTNAYNVMVYRLKELQKDLAKAEREAAWKEMAQQVAHEIKNPLTPMKLNLQHLERQLKANPKDFEELKPKIEAIASNMIEQIESLNNIASDFSKFAQPSTKEYEPIELNELLNAVTELYAPDQNLKVDCLLHSSDLWVQGAKDELRRVFINLVKNAIEAVHEKGTVTLSSGISEDSTTAILSVEDTGEGIPEENQDQIFVPNFSTKSSGTGLGLAIAKKIIEEHNGEISFSSEVGEGTVFIIHLPLQKPESAST